jgi:hypothetical protein
MMKTMIKAMFLVCLLLAVLPMALAGTGTIEMPVPGPGETLYLGTAQFEQAGSFEMAFVLGADGATIRDVTILMKDVSIAVVEGTSTGKLNISDSRQRFGAEYALTEGDDTDMDTAKLLGVRFADEGIEAILDYTYTYTSFDGSFTSSTVPFGQREIVFKAQ